MKPSPRNRQFGSALLVFVALILAAMSFVIVKALNSSTEAGRNETNAAVLAQAKQALIAYAATYRDYPSFLCPTLGPSCPFGYLPCPDTNNDGITELNCGATNVSVIGRLPWKTLGLPPLRDSNGECLWYAVSGRAKYNPPTSPLFKNWDTLSGQFQIDDADGSTLVVADTNDTPWAVVFSPGAARSGQDRTAAVASECGGNDAVTAYLDGADALYTAPATVIANTNSVLTLSTTNSISDGTNNDQGQWITSNEIFDVVKNRSDFNDETDAMLDYMQSCLEGSPPAATGSKGMVNVITLCPGTTQERQNVVSNWSDNLLYTKPVASVTVNGTAGCDAVLLFGGKRTTRTTTPLIAQTRTAATSGQADMYLETPNDTLFPSGSGYDGATHFDPANASRDIARCIKTGATQFSFANPVDFASFIPAGAGVTTNTTDTYHPTVSIDSAAGTSGGCFWLPSTVALAGTTVRTYYNYQFSYADPTGGADRGNGITLDIVDGSLGSPTALCGLESRMGAFVVGDPTGMWALESFTIETDVYRDAANSDSAENHTAIMANGNPAHSAANGNLTGACDGTAAGCRATPANKFEESITPSLHNQRIEIHSGCNSTCTTCNPASHVSPNTYVKISTWVDCTDCSDVTADSVTTPTINRCIILTTELNSPYIALTGGFRSGASIQGVTLSNFILRSE
jgi:type II secretory pathway pseudopilin PulG